MHSMQTRRQSAEKIFAANESPEEFAARFKTTYRTLGTNEKPPVPKVMNLNMKYDPKLKIWYGRKHPSEIDASQVKEYAPHINM